MAIYLTTHQPGNYISHLRETILLGSFPSWKWDFERDTIKNIDQNIEFRYTIKEHEVTFFFFEINNSGSFPAEKYERYTQDFKNYLASLFPFSKAYQIFVSRPLTVDDMIKNQIYRLKYDKLHF